MLVRKIWQLVNFWVNYPFKLKSKNWPGRVTVCACGPQRLVDEPQNSDRWVEAADKATLTSKGVDMASVSLSTDTTGGCKNRQCWNCIGASCKVILAHRDPGRRLLLLSEGNVAKSYRSSLKLYLLSQAFAVTTVRSQEVYGPWHLHKSFNIVCCC